MEKYGPLQPLVSILSVVCFCEFSLISTALTWFPTAQPQTPNLEDDINEVILRDAGIDLVVVRSTPPEQRRKTMVTMIF